MKIALVIPSRGNFQKTVPDVIKGLAPAGVDVMFHDQCFLTHGHFAGTDKQRLDAFVEVSNDPGVDAVWFARGGYGACRIALDALPLLNNHARDKMYLGYSDAGFILSGLYKNGIGHPVHSPMAADTFFYDSHAPAQRVFSFLADGKSGIEPGCNSQPSVAFNLKILTSMLDTELVPSFKDHVVVLEDTDEHLYSIDRCLFNVMNSRAMRGAAGVRMGRFSRIPENDIPFGETVEEMFMRWSKKTGIPYLGPADIGHDAENKIVPFGKL